MRSSLCGEHYIKPSLSNLTFIKFTLGHHPLKYLRFVKWCQLISLVSILKTELIRQWHYWWVILMCDLKLVVLLHQPHITEVLFQLMLDGHRKRSLCKEERRSNVSSHVDHSQAFSALSSSLDVFSTLSVAQDSNDPCAVELTWSLDKQTSVQLARDEPAALKPMNNRGTNLHYSSLLIHLGLILFFSFHFSP